MPIYEYKCRLCNHQFELQRCIADADNAVACPDCQSTQTTRLMSRVNSFTRSTGGESKSISSGGCASCHPSSAHACASCRH